MRPEAGEAASTQAGTVGATAEPAIGTVPYLSPEQRLKANRRRNISAQIMLPGIGSDWQANPRIFDVRAIKTVPFVPLSHPFIERLIGTIQCQCLGEPALDTGSGRITGARIHSWCLRPN